MKQNHHPNGNGARLIPVQFEFTHPTAHAVAVAGTFNQWQPEAKTLHATGHGHWRKETALAPGTYEYCLIVDGQWMPDPSAKETVPNPFGGRNSILKVSDPMESARPATTKTTQSNAGQKGALKV